MGIEVVAGLPVPKFSVELIKKKNSHYYKIGENVYPGVTTVLNIIAKDALVPWAKKVSLEKVRAELYRRLDGKAFKQLRLRADWIDDLISASSKLPDQIRDDAADYGTRAHAFIDNIVKGGEPQDVPPDIVPTIASFHSWWKSSGLQLVAGDTKVGSKQHSYGGSLDGIGYQNGKYVLIDFKTSNNCYPTMALQVAAYARAFGEMFGVLCRRAIIVRFGKTTPDFEVKEVADVDFSFEAFLAAKQLHHIMRLNQFNEN